jgi:hypothetical protein
VPFVKDTNTGILATRVSFAVMANDSSHL